MPCYRSGGCGPYESRSCSECPASKPSYLTHRDGPTTVKDVHAGSDMLAKMAQAPDIKIPGWEQITVHDEAAADLQSILDRYPTTRANPDADPPDSIEICVQLKIDIKTGTLQRIYPVMRGGKFVTFTVKTADGWASYGKAREDAELAEKTETSRIVDGTLDRLKAAPEPLNNPIVFPPAIQ